MKRGVLFAGGGTLGPVVPLLAVAARIREADSDIPLFWAGTDLGPERELVESNGIRFFTVPVAKLPRYVSSKLLTLPFDYIRARNMSGLLLQDLFPRVVVSAGGFTAVPVVREAVDRGIPCISHQLDYKPGLSNRIIAHQCRYVTTSFSYARSPFHADVTMYQIPTPSRFSKSDLPTRESACRYFAFDPSNLVLFITGGGTGAAGLNKAIGMIKGALPSDLQILHLTGKGKTPAVIPERPGYVMREFLSDEMITAYAAADIILSRAGVGAISELAALSKPSILVPYPDSPQIANAKALKDAVRVVDSSTGGWIERLESEIVHLIEDESERIALGKNLHDTFQTDKGEALANLILSVMV